MISSTLELLHEWTCLLRLCFLAFVASSISGEAGLETSHLTLSHICANHFDTGKSTQPGSAGGLLCSAENCLPTICSHEEYARKNIIVRKQREPITLFGQWSPWKQHGLAWQQGTTQPPIHPSLEDCESGATPAVGTRHFPSNRDRLKQGWDIGLQVGLALKNPLVDRAGLQGAGYQCPMVSLGQGLTTPGWAEMGS